MLDPKLIKEKREIVEDMLKARNVDFDLDALIRADKKRRELIIETDELRKKRNEIGIQISQKKKAGENTTQIVNKMVEVSAELERKEPEQKTAEEEYSRLALTVPNLVHESVPRGIDESANKEIRKWGDIPNFDFKINDHIDISQNLDLVDLPKLQEQDFIF